MHLFNVISLETGRAEVVIGPKLVETIFRRFGRSIEVDMVSDVEWNIHETKPLHPRWLKGRGRHVGNIRVLSLPLKT